MALRDRFTKTAPRANRVDALLEELKDSEDLEVLQHALRSKSVSYIGLTKAIRAEYGHDVVEDNSVAEWRQAHLAEITGL